MEVFGSVQIIKVPNPRGPKTYGSGTQILIAKSCKMLQLQKILLKKKIINTHLLPIFYSYSVNSNEPEDTGWNAKTYLLHFRTKNLPQDISYLFSY